MPDKKKCYVYVRVSTQLQASEGYSLDAQRNRLAQAAAYHGLDVVREFADEGISGKTAADRPRFMEMLRLIENGNPDGVRYVLVYKLSRFARNAADALSCIQLMEDNDVALIAAEEGIDSSGPTGKLVISILASIAELELSTIKTQMMAGIQQKAREGGWNGGHVPFGYRLVRDGTSRSGRLEIDPDEAAVVRMIFDMYAHAQIGYSGVAKRLNDEGYGRSRGKYAAFTDSSIKTILDNPLYIGKTVYRRFAAEKIKGTRNRYRVVRRDAYDIYDGQHEAIIDQDLWEEVRAKRMASAGKHAGHHGPRHVHMLSGIVRCPECGGPMYGMVNQRKRKDGSPYTPIYYYVCRNAKRHTGKECSFSRSVRAENLDEDVAKVLRMALESMDFAEEVKAAYGRKEDLDELSGRLDGLQEERKKLERRKSRLIGNIADLDADDDQYDAMYRDLRDALRRINEAASDLDVRIGDAAARLRNAREGSLSQERMLRYVKEATADLGSWKPEKKRRLMHEFLDSVEILPEPTPSGGLVRRVRFRFPMFPVTMDGKTRYSDFIDLKYDDETPPDDDPPRGGGMPPSGSPPSGGDTPPESPAPDGGYAPGEDFTPIQNNGLPRLLPENALHPDRQQSQSHRMEAHRVFIYSVRSCSFCSPLLGNV